jgi:hypothetical protein
VQALADAWNRVAEKTTDTKDTVTAESGPNTTHNGSSPGANLQLALDELRQAILTKKSEPICAAYLALQHASAGMQYKELFEAIDKVAGPTGRHMIISAFAHRQCFMCNGGAIACDQCHGTGLTSPGRICPHCDGFGIAFCTFCQGTGWAEMTTTPPEIARSVQSRQVHHVLDEMARFQQQLAVLSPEKIQSLSRADRIKLDEWLMRSQARMGELQDRHNLLDQAQEARFNAAIADIDRLLEALVECNRLEAVAAMHKKKEPPSATPSPEQT